MASDNDFLALAYQLADVAGDAIRPFFKNPGTVTEKADKSPVTLADQMAEDVMRALIIDRYPDHGILGEEDEAFGMDRDYVWVLDPIDGTRAFLEGKKEWGTLIALCHHGEPILGILDQPVTKERWVGSRGGKASFNRKPIAARDCEQLSSAEISTTSDRYFTPTQARRFVTLAENCKSAVKDGDCYAYGLLAKGERDLVVDAGLKPYDIIPLRPIIEAAGGKLTGWDGKPITLTNFETALAAGDARAHAEALKLLALT